jgi:hypothetical protein
VVLELSGGVFSGGSVIGVTLVCSEVYLVRFLDRWLGE